MLWGVGVLDLESSKLVEVWRDEILGLRDEGILGDLGKMIPELGSGKFGGVLGARPLELRCNGCLAI